VANAARSVAGPTLSTLELTGEFRRRVWGGDRVHTSTVFLYGGAGLSRVSLSTETHSGVSASAGVAVTWPLADAIGLETRLGAVNVGHPARFLGAPGDSLASVRQTALRFGVHIFLRPSAKARALPVQSMPDATEVLRPLASYQGMLFRRDSALAAAIRSGDDRLGADPDARSGAALTLPYLVRQLATRDSARFDTTAHGSARVKRSPTGKSRSASSTAKVADDSVTGVSAAFVPAPSQRLATTAPRIETPTPPVTTPSATLPTPPTPPATATPSVQPAQAAIPVAAPQPRAREAVPIIVDRAAARPVDSPAIAPVSPARADSVESFTDSTGAYLAIQPPLTGGQHTVVEPAAITRLVEFAKGLQLERRVASYIVLVESAPADESRTAPLVDAAYAIRARLLAVGVAPAAALVMESPAPLRTSRLRVIVRQPTP
jgi:hypothetical protein